MGYRLENKYRNQIFGFPDFSDFRFLLKRQEPIEKPKQLVGTAPKSQSSNSSGDV